MRKLVDACINPNPEQRPDIVYVYDVAKRMYTPVPPSGEAKWDCLLAVFDSYVVNGNIHGKHSPACKHVQLVWSAVSNSYGVCSKDVITVLSAAFIVE